MHETEDSNYSRVNQDVPKQSKDNRSSDDITIESMKCGLKRIKKLLLSILLLATGNFNTSCSVSDRSNYSRLQACLSAD